MKSERRRTVMFIVGCAMFAIMTGIVAVCTVSVYAAVIRAGGNTSAAVGAVAGMCVVLAAVFFVVDSVRRKYSVDMPVKRILAATELMMKGNFDINLTPLHEWGKYDEFDLIAENVSRVAAELSHTEMLRADFISDVSHEIKTPVSVIRNYASVLADGSLSDEERKECLTIMSEAAERLGKLVTDVLRLNKLENQRLLPEKSKFDLSESLTRCVLAFSDDMDKKGLDIECDIEENVRIYSDESLLEIIWNNLLSNAVKFTDAGGKIYVCLRHTETGATVEVRDTGCGMSRETGERIFEKFYQGDKSRSGEGNGLGLALVKRVIDMLGGDIRVESVPDKGSSFVVEIKADKV